MNARTGHPWSRLTAAWRVVGWPLVGLLAMTALVLGFVGYGIFYRHQDIPKSPTDLAFQSMSLFVMETDQVPRGDTPWQLDIARFLAPAVAATALVAAAAIVFRNEFEEVRLRRRRHHVVVCGLGGRGSHLAKDLVDAGYAVVAVERDEGVPSVCELRRDHVLTVIGDARDPDVLRRAGVPHASHVVAVTGTDDVNAEVVTRCGQLAATRRGDPLTCLADIKDPDLCSLLRAEELAGLGRRGYRLDFINVYEQGARAMLEEHPPFPGDGGTPHVMVIGLNPLGSGLIVEIARRWASRAATVGPAVVTVVDPEPERVLHGLRARHEHPLRTLQLLAVSADVADPDCAWLGGAPPSAIYVCIDDGSVSLEVALQLCRCPAAGTAHVVAQMSGAAGLAGLLDKTSSAGRLHLFNLPDRAFGADLLIGGTYELLARAIHERYRTQRFKEGARAGDDPALVPWKELPEALKESNRSQASHIGVKLAAIGCGIVPAADVDAHDPVFTDAEVEVLARLEHARWVDERRRDGWKPGPRNAVARTTPYLIPWEQLGEDVRELDREAVRAIPALLSIAGYRILRAGADGDRAAVDRSRIRAAGDGSRTGVPAAHGP